MDKCSTRHVRNNGDSQEYPLNRNEKSCHVRNERNRTGANIVPSRIRKYPEKKNEIKKDGSQNDFGEK